jgi:hypothetical protein
LSGPTGNFASPLSLGCAAADELPSRALVMSGSRDGGESPSPDDFFIKNSAFALVNCVNELRRGTDSDRWKA